MNRKNFHSRTGYEAQLEPSELGFFLASVSMKDGGSIACIASTESEALKDLAELVYEHNREIVIKNQDYRCARCGRLTALEVHHKVYRSKGRNDALSNLEAICPGCHHKEHN